MKNILLSIMMACTISHIARAQDQGYIRADEIDQLDGWQELEESKRWWADEMHDTDKNDWYAVRTHKEVVNKSYDKKTNGTPMLEVQQLKPLHHGRFAFSFTEPDVFRLVYIKRKLIKTNSFSDVFGAQLVNFLYLQENNLTDITSLFQLPVLQRLWLSKNNMSALPKGLCDLVHLQKLCLDTNQLTSLEGLEHLIHLKYKLCLRSNKLTGIPQVAAMTKLKRLDIRDNKIEQLDQAWLVPCKKLGELMVDDHVMLPKEWCKRSPHAGGQNLYYSGGSGVQREKPTVLDDGTILPGFPVDYAEQANSMTIRILRLTSGRVFIQSSKSLEKVRNVHGQRRPYFIAPDC